MSGNKINLIEYVSREIGIDDPEMANPDATTRAAIYAILSAGYRIIPESDVERAQQALTFASHRLVNVYGEPNNIDFILTMKESVKALSAKPEGI